MTNIDPTSALIDTRLPIAFLPVRLETRFVPVQGAPQLLVRIYPDDVHIDRTGSAPARARLLPDAFVALGYTDQPVPTPATPGGALFAVRGNPIQEDPPIAPDPAAAAHDPWDPGSRWLADFDDAERRGLAIRVPLDAATAQRGLTRLVVVGVRSGDAAARVAALFAAHRQSDGLGVVPIGTPTNNTVDGSSGWASETTPPDAAVVDGADALAAEQALGLPRGTIASAPNGGVRQLDGQRRMNTLLWPATWGYFLKHMMAAADTHAPLLSAETLAWIRRHFIDYVRADGPLPAVRVGRQPYGLLPVTSLAGWPAGDRTERLATLLRSMRDRLFRPAAASALHLTPGQRDLDRAVGDLLVQQPHAWRYTGRSLLGGQDLRTLFGLMRWPPASPATDAALPFFHTPHPNPEGTLHGWTLTGSGAVPAQLPWTSDDNLYGQALRDRELAATALMRDVFSDLGTTWRPRLGRGSFFGAVFPIGTLVRDGSYLSALAADAKTFLSMRNETPPALLDRLARHAVLLEGSVIAGRSSVDNDLFNIPPPQAAPWLISLWSSDLGEAATTVKGLAGNSGDLTEVRDALAVLAALAPPDLEALLTGTLDLCSHRIDAWITSLAQRVLAGKRTTTPSGLYVGGYGWVTDLRPQSSNPPAPDEHMLTPSLDHAVTAAILRAGYQAHRASGDGAMAVDLSSARVRLALWLLDGVRQGQPLGALLGYRFERGLQERSRPGHVLGAYIAPLRRFAPLAGDLIPSGVSESVAAHDVVDGLALARIYQANRDLGTPLPLGVTATVEARVRVDRIVDDYAAIVSKIDQSLESEYMLAIGSDRRVAFCWHTESGSTWGTPPFNMAFSTQTVPLGRWVHVAAVRDRATVTFYIDGVPVGSSAVADAARFRMSGLPVRIGLQRPGFRGFVGRVREVRLWNVAHAPADILALAAGPLRDRTAGLAACWRFDEGSGASIGDRSPYRRTGIVAGAGNPPWVQVSATDDPVWGPGSALEFNGTQYVEMPHAQNLSLGAIEGLPAPGVDRTVDVTATIEARVRVDRVADDYAAIVSKIDQSPESEYMLAIGNDRRVAFCWHTENGMTWGTPPFSIASSTQPVPLGRWVHVAVVRDRATVTFYIDGVPAGSSTVADGGRFRISATKLPVRLGVQRPGFRGFAGRVRDVRMWTVAQTPGDVAELAAGRLRDRTAGLAAWWRFDEGTGSSIADRSSFRSTGTLAGAPPWVQVTASEDPVWGAGPALELNGTQYVEIPHAQNLSIRTTEGPAASGADDYTLVTAELDALCDTVDAISDLTLAESVHHVALGNPSRAGAVLDALSRGELPPPEIDVARTPRGGVIHAHRLAALFADGGTRAATGWPADATRLRAAAEPLVNEWAAAVLGLAGNVRYRGEYLDASGVVVSSADYSLNETGLALTPLDVVYGAPGKGDPGSSEMEQRLIYQRMLRPPAGIAWTSVRVDFSRRTEWRIDWISVSELLEVAAALRRVLDQARPLAGRDLVASGEIDLTDADDLALRVALVTTALTARKAAFGAPGMTPVKLRAALLAASFAGLPGAIPRSVRTTDTDLAILNGQVRAAIDEIDRRLARAAAATGDLGRLIALFGGGIRIVPRLKVPPALRDALRAAFRLGAAQPGWDDATLHPAAWDWLSRVANVREAARHVDDLLLYDTALNSSASALRVAQMPPRDGETWIGLPGSSASLPGGRVSLVALTPGGSLDLDRLAGGLVVDEWTEVVPRATHTAGLAFHADAPGAAPPHAILLAVANDARPNWDLAGLEAVLNETLDLARMRMVGPKDLGAANHFLPATLLAFNPDGDTVSTDLVPLG